MTELLPNIFAIEVPEDSKDHGLVHIFAREDILYWYDKRGKKDSMWINLNAYHAKILFTTKGVTEQQAKKAVEKHYNGGAAIYPFYFRDYEKKDIEFSYGKATESLQSLLKSKGLTAGNYLIIKKISL